MGHSHVGTRHAAGYHWKRLTAVGKTKRTRKNEKRLISAPDKESNKDENKRTARTVFEAV